jgi:hypothetical protein
LVEGVFNSVVESFNSPFFPTEESSYTIGGVFDVVNCVVPFVFDVLGYVLSNYVSKKFLVLEEGCRSRYLNLLHFSAAPSCSIIGKVLNTIFIVINSVFEAVFIVVYTVFKAVLVIVYPVFDAIFVVIYAVLEAVFIIVPFMF